MGPTRIAILSVALAILYAAPPARTEPERPLERITIAYSSLSANMAPLWITHERGLFRKHGLDAQLVFIESGATTVQSLNSGEVAFAQMAGAGVIQSRLQGADVVMIAGVVNTLTFKLYVDPRIATPQDLVGKSAAVTRFGSSTDFALRYALERYGLTPMKDIALLESGNMPAILKGLESGRIQAAMLSSPFTLRAKKMGFKLLADLQMLGLEYQHTGLATTGGLIRSRPDLVRRVVSAYVEGIHFYKTRRAESLAILARYLKTDEPEVLEEIYEDIGLALTPQKPYPTLRGIEIMLRELAVRKPKAKNARPEQFVNVTALQELDRSGYIDRLYREQPVLAGAQPGHKKEAPPASRPDAASRATSRAAADTAGAAASGMSAKDPQVLAAGTRPERPEPRRSESSRPEKPTGDAAPPATEETQPYTVVAGDTLSHIALRYYGDHLKWDRIYQANRSTMRNPHFLYIGQVILIPAR